MIKFNFCILCSLMLFLAIILSVVGVDATNLRIATYNIWNPVFEEKYSGKNTWDQRRSYIIENILKSESDIICLEEVGKNSFNDLTQNSVIHRQYKSVYVSHAPNSPGQGEGRDGLALLYKADKVNLQNIVISKDGSRPTHRRDFIADFKLKRSHKAFRVACTHLDSGENLEIGNQQLACLVRDVLNVDTIGIDFVVVCGDFNEGENEFKQPRYEIMDQAGFMTDGSVVPTRPEALNVRHNGHVDWIYFKKISESDFYLLAIQPIGDEKASDHKLTLTEIDF